jgi:hypothetical protein
MNILNQNPVNIRDELGKIIGLYCNLDNMFSKIGYFTVLNRDTRRVIFLCQIGNRTSDENMKYSMLSIEKGFDLFKSKHISSCQSRDPQMDHWVGAIAISQLILSLAGLPELGAEAFILFLSSRLKFGTPEEINYIQGLNNNPIFTALVDRDKID